MALSFIPRRVRRVVGGTSVLLALAGASAACGTNDGTPQVIAFAGSDTTQDVMAEIADQYDDDGGYNPDPDDNENVLAIVASPDGGEPVPADAHCAARTYRTPPGAGEFARPNGSSAGRNALKASVQAGDGCIDVARSSGPPRAIPTDLASFEYYAFGLDALGWSSASTLAPTNLTHAQLQGIYNCTFTNWNQVGGGNGQIERYMPQTGSGTYQFAVSDTIGFDPAPFSGPNCPAVQFVQENSGSTIAANGDQQTAVVPYSVANWVAMSRGVIGDERAGQDIRSLNGQAPKRLVNGVWEARTPTAADPTGPVAESNVRLNDPTPAYPGIRYVWNVIDNTSVSYTPAKRFVGFDNVASPTITSPLCAGDKAGTIAQFGFGPLDKTADAVHNIPGTACRFWQPS